MIELLFMEALGLEHKVRRQEEFSGVDSSGKIERVQITGGQV